MTSTTLTQDRKERIKALLTNGGINQIARLEKPEWAFIKRLVVKGEAYIALDYGFPRTTKRYLLEVAA